MLQLTQGERASSLFPRRCCSILLRGNQSFNNEVTKMAEGFIGEIRMVGFNFAPQVGPFVTDN